MTLIDNGTVSGINDALQEAVDNNACVVIYNDSGNLVYHADSLGTWGVFLMMKALPDELVTNDARVNLLEDGTEYSQNLTNTVTGQDMIVYGRKIAVNSWAIIISLLIHLWNRSIPSFLFSHPSILCICCWLWLAHRSCHCICLPV
jgi:hypothetical protein